MSIWFESLIKRAFLCPHLTGPDYLPHLPNHYVLYQLENLKTWTVKSPTYLKIALNSQQIWEFSPWQLERYWSVLGAATMSRLLPVYTPQAPLIEALQRWENGDGGSTTGDIDVLFYGGMSDRRGQMKEELEAWAKVHHVSLVFDLSYGVTGGHREDLLRRAKVVLNLHSVPSRVLEVSRIM